MIATLPMYERPANRAAHDAVWALIRDALRDTGIAAPDHLSRGIAYHAAWSHDDLVLSHICVRPFNLYFHRSVTVIGASDYGLAGCAPGYYRSAYIMRADDTRQPAPTLRLAANSPDSHSGFGALTALGRVGTSTLFTGSHDASLIAVAEGRADLAAIDQQTWTMQQRDMPQASTVRVAGYSPAAPGQTFVTGAGRDPAPYLAAITQAIAALPDAHRDTLGLRGIVTLASQAYAVCAAA
ncbi:PhnD/SsuA/transferrin family substrate-binding protein [Loktanella sp. SALINAS62]|uniref:phosphate/phosphite/phosphonate ABC transporter substrate-binding protein n=1 Tax=Loktanella sp. SALINAS62 TaxID=2706124 RepID=UPI001B8D8185|nr:PhnD/SsuA/transferrin family substrate-binding protein [Loktanella sp. SALINAS62]MBS1303926.1 PhnD/SsuA/transferrin family substrate-binding protein [Loktanella sp. SALINAS62]